MSWRGLRHKGVEPLRPREWNAVVDALNDLYSWLFAGTSDVRVKYLTAEYAEFAFRPRAEGRAVLLDGDPIGVYQFYDLAVQQITGAIDAARATALLEQLYGKVPSAADITSAVNAAEVTQHAAATARKLDAACALLQQIYGKTPSAADVTAAIDAAAVTGYAADAREHARRAADALEAYAPLLADIRDRAREVRDVVVRISVDEYGRVGVKIAEPLDEYGRVVVSAPGELLDELRPVWARGSVSAAENTAGFGVALYKGGRPFVNIYYRLGGAGDVYLKGSVDGVTWRVLKAYALAAAAEDTDAFMGLAYPYVRLETPTAGIDVEFEIVASR
jgi:hypothetical protein